MITAWLVDRVADQLGRIADVTADLSEYLRVVANLFRAAP